MRVVEGHSSKTKTRIEKFWSMEGAETWHTKPLCVF